MLRLLTFIAAIGLASSSVGSPSIVVRSLSNVRLDGTCSGTIEDTLANYPQLLGELQTAVHEYLTKRFEEATAARNAALERLLEFAADESKRSEAIAAVNAAAEARTDCLSLVARSSAAGITLPASVEEKIPPAPPEAPPAE